MPKLKNSFRRINTATYVPIKHNPDEDDNSSVKKIKRGFSKMSYLKALNISNKEVPKIKQKLPKDVVKNNSEQIKNLFELLDKINNKRSASDTLKNIPKVANIESEHLVLVGRLLAEVRKDVRSEIETELFNIKDEFLKDNANIKKVKSNKENIKTKKLDNKKNVKEITVNDDNISCKDNAGMSRIIEWASINKKDIYDKVVDLSGYNDSKAFTIRDRLKEYRTDLFDKIIIDWNAPENTDDIVDGFEESMKIEPIGRLHLERIEMFPVGIERGELLYTLPLAPHETVNIIEKEWTVKNREYEELVSDSFEGYSEDGVTEKNDLSQSTQSQTSHESAFSLSGSYTYLGATAAIGYNTSAKDEHSEKLSRNHSIGITRKASSRVKKDHKYSFKVVEKTGTERSSGRLISNTSNEAMRIDYFQLIRKWQVDLYRYGLRMTYDIVIPSPGKDLLAKIIEIDRIEKDLSTPFEFNLPLSSIDRNHWDYYAAKYGAIVKEPPPSHITHEEANVYQEDTQNFFDTLTFSVDGEYEVDSVRFIGRFDPSNDDPNDAYLDVVDDNKGPVKFSNVDNREEGRLKYESLLTKYNGQSGSFEVAYVGQKLREGVARLTVRSRLRESAFRKWRLETWETIREAAENEYFQMQDRLRERHEKLINEMSSKDALSLRKMEREEVMKGILRWLFGPDFEIVPNEITSILQGENENSLSSITQSEWSQVISYGEFIKFIQQAIEWENVAYFTYPYFWSPNKRTLKRWLNHPDPRHREFLRAGAARVVLTIRPGFEKSFTELIENGSFGELELNHPYITVAEEIEKYAKTNYPGIPPANQESESSEVEVEDKEKGILIGQWFEYTPSSGIDLSVNKPIQDLA